MKHFTIAELCRSNTADRFAIDNRCKKEHVVYLTQLVENVLDPLRESKNRRFCHQRPHERNGRRYHRRQSQREPPFILPYSRTRFTIRSAHR